MTEIFNRLIRIPNWLLFILLIFVPASFSNTEVGTYKKITFGLLVVVWMIKVGEQLYVRIKGKTTINFNLFSIGLLIAYTYFSMILLLTDGYNITSEKDNYAEYGNVLYIYIFGHLISFGAYLYGLHFTARAIQILEEQLFGKRTDYGTLLAALFFFPIGIWWTQPKINRILKTPMADETQ